MRNGRQVQTRRFMLVDPWRLILLEPNSANLGMGIVRYGRGAGVVEETGKRRGEFTALVRPWCAVSWRI